MYGFSDGQILCDTCAKDSSSIWRGEFFINNNPETFCEVGGEDELEEEDIDVS